MKDTGKKSLFSLTVFITCLFLLSLPSGAGAADMEDYCQVPPFVTKTIQPNLLLIHLVQTDYAQHATGRHSARSKRASGAGPGSGKSILD